MKTIVKSFFQGLIILVPMVVTVYVFYLTFVKIDGLLNISIPGLGFLITLTLITVVGFFAANLMTKKLFDLPGEGIHRVAPGQIDLLFHQGPHQRLRGRKKDF